MSYDTMIVDREPFFLTEFSKISVAGRSVVAVDKNGVVNLPISSIHTLLIGRGSSITSDAAALCAKHNCYIAFVTGGANVQSIWHCGRYQNPKKLIKQAEVFNSPSLRLESAKRLLIIRLETVSDEIHFNKEMLSRINDCESVASIMGLEGYFTKAIYAHFSSLAGIKFKRNNVNATDKVNTDLSILSNVLYGFVSSTICALGYSPSLGIIHGQTRRGGLAFDIADVIKPRLALEPAFRQSPTKNRIRDLSKELNRRKKFWVKFTIATIESCYANVD